MPTTAHKLGPGSLKIGATGTPQEFAAQMTAGKLTPEVNEEDAIPVFDGTELDGDDTISWTLGGTLLQSFDKAGLIHWAYQNRLAKLPFTFIPSTEFSDYGWRGTVKVVPLEVGGDGEWLPGGDFLASLVIGDVSMSGA